MRTANRSFHRMSETLFLMKHNSWASLLSSRSHLQCILQIPYTVNHLSCGNQCNNMRRPKTDRSSSWTEYSHNGNHLPYTDSITRETLCFWFCPCGGKIRSPQFFSHRRRRERICASKFALIGANLEVLKISTRERVRFWEIVLLILPLWGQNQKSSIFQPSQKRWEKLGKPKPILLGIGSTSAPQEPLRIILLSKKLRTSNFCG